MTQKIVSLLSLLFALIACQTSTEEPPTTNTPLPPPTSTTMPAISPSPILPPTDLPPTAYPDNPPDNGYPPPAPTTDIVEAYPGMEPVWVVQPAGKQCEEYKVDLATTEATLLNAGIQLLSIELTELIVCSACDCPTSEHYRALIPRSDLEVLLPLGWVEEP